MRQFLGGILVAAVLWWVYGAAFGPSAAAAGSSDASVVPRDVASGPGVAVPPVGTGLNINTLFQDGQVAGSSAAGASPVTGALADQRSLADAVVAVTAALQERQPAAIDRAWTLLAAGLPGDGGVAVVGAGRQRLLTAVLAGEPQLQPSGRPDPAAIAAALPMLGRSNRFLHSSEGREFASRIAAAIQRLPDADAVSLGSRLLELSLRGRIELQDRSARQWVDTFYAQHRLPVDRWLCDPTNVQGSRSHTVVAGESLAKIAARCRREKIFVEDGTLAILNRIQNANVVRVGQRLKIPVEPIRSVVEKRSYSLAVYVGDALLRMYWVGHGESDKTPVTDFVVGDKEPRPQWTAPDGNVYAYGDPKNILGEYFIKLLHSSYTGFGIHGTPMPETIGTMSSMGCVRMRADDIAELFRLLPRGTVVSVRASDADA
jgi:hypothetical protein